MYKAIIFDLGKVIFDLSFDRTFQYWATASGLPIEDIRESFSFDGVFCEFERNEISPEQFRMAVSQQLNIRLTDEEFDRGWCHLYLDLYPGIEDLLIDRKKTHRLIALTNTNIIHGPFWKTRYADALRHFETIFSSHEMGVRKPEKEAYSLVLNTLHLQPHEVVFLDDRVENIQGAEEVGMKTILVTAPEQMSHDLASLLSIDLRED